jgi:hypothetical protein
MERERALVELSTAHAVALRLRDAGAGDEQIAVALGVPVEGIGAFLEVAEAKLAALWPAESDAGSA